MTDHIDVQADEMDDNISEDTKYPTLEAGLTILHEKYYDVFDLSGGYSHGIIILSVAIVGGAEWDWAVYQGAFRAGLYKSARGNICQDIIKIHGNKIMEDEAMKLFSNNKISELIYRG